jgi:hypothetical protein
MGVRVEIAIVNQSSLGHDVVATMAAAVERQLIEHAAPAWQRVAPAVSCHGRLETVTPTAMPVVIFDRAWSAAAHGYHRETPDGRAYARVFIDVVIEDGGVVLYDGPRLTVASVVSHEAIEIFIDPDCNVWADGPPTPYGSCYAVEVCDPVNGDVYPIAGSGGTQVGVSNFVFPDWFDPEAAPGTQLDHLRHLTRPFNARPGGHTLVRWRPGTETMLSSLPLPAPARIGAMSHPAARSMRRVMGAGQGGYGRRHGLRATTARSATT